MGKITKKQPKLCGLSSRRVRQIVQQRLSTECNLLQSQIDSSTTLQNTDTGASNATISSSNLELPTTIDICPPSKVNDLNTNCNLSSSLLTSNNVNSNTFCFEEEPFNTKSNDINSSSSLFPDNDENVFASYIKDESCEIECNDSDNFILNDDSCDSDFEVTCNEDTRKTDSDLDENNTEFPDYEICTKINDFEIKLRQWALLFNITLIALSALLLLLRIFDSSLPIDARTLLQTPKKIETIEICEGSYYHFGLERAIKNIIHEKSRKNIQDKNIKLMINVDGVPISKSGTNGFWMILGSEINSETVYPIGAFYGTKKPVDANEFLNPFVKEAIGICNNGLENYNVTIEALICDAPAKSFVLYLKGHTGYDCCPKCLIKGECHRPPATKKGKKNKGRVCFPGIGPFLLKSDEVFKLNKYNNSESDVQTVLVNLPRFGCISSIPLDYMHLLLLGVMKKLISFWVLGKSKVKVPSKVIQSISDRLLLLRNSIPDEFNRKPRSLWEFKFWKATELRTFLLYAGVVVLKNVDGFPSELYSHFLLLHTAVSIIICERHIGDPRNINVAHEMLELFVKDFELLYGKEFISYNVHNILHICKDVKRFGALDNFSAFKFENYMGTVKRMIRKGDKPLEQLARRYAEVENIQKYCSSIERFTLEQHHNRGPLTVELLTNVPEQYKVIKTKGFSLKCYDLKNNCVMLKDGTFLIVENIIKHITQDIHLIGHKLGFTRGLYDIPDSRHLNIYLIRDGNKDEKHCVPLTDVVSKVWKIPTTEGSAVIPLLHKINLK